MGWDGRDRRRRKRGREEGVRTVFFLVDGILGWTRGNSARVGPVSAVRY